MKIQALAAATLGTVILAFSPPLPASADSASLPICNKQTLTTADLEDLSNTDCSLAGSIVEVSPDLLFVVPTEGELATLYVNSVIPGESITTEVANLGQEGVVVTISTPREGAQTTPPETEAYGAPETIEEFNSLQEAAVAEKSDESSAANAAAADNNISASAAAVSQKCTNSTRKWLGKDWAASEMGWYYNGAGVGSPTTLRAGVSRGGYITAEGVNNCNLSQSDINFNQRYNGTTSRTANIYTDTGLCDNNGHDGTSTISWGPNFKTGVIAYTCSWVAVGTRDIIEADIAFKSTLQWHAGTDACPTSSYYRLNQVAAHEFGHAFGLDDLEDVSTEQLMRGTTYRCEANGTLGLGDWVAMADIY